LISITKDELNGAAPRELAALPVNIMEDKRVRPRYLVGRLFQKIAVWSKRIVPALFFEKLILAYYKI